MAMDMDQLRSQRKDTSSLDESWVDYEELYDELFSRAEQSMGAQLYPTGKHKDDGGDE